MTNHPNRNLAARNRRITAAYRARWASLDALCDHLNSDDNGGDLDMQLLPTYGGKDPDDTDGVWSWDAKRLLIETNTDFIIVNR